MINRNGHFDFEEPILKILKRIEEISAFSADPGSQKEKEKLEKKLQKTRRDVFAKLTRWQKTLVARHPKRPYTLDYIEMLFEDFTELHGDRRFADDKAMIGGMALFHGKPVVVIGHQKGRDTKQNIYRNFGMPQPEGYRKALRIMKLAEKFNRPVFTFVDTPGAWAGMGAEQRGQAEAIAFNLREMAGLGVPIITTITGEGGSGGALAIGVGDEVNMLEFAIYSVISPEACSAILWKNQDKAIDAAENLRLTAPDLKAYDVIDEIIPEPEGGAHTDPRKMAQTLDGYLTRSLEKVSGLSTEDRVERRYLKFRRMGVFEEAGDPG